jgi:hypothetical protein
MTGDWLAMLGIAVMLLAPFYFGAVFLGASIGAALRIRQRRRRMAATPARGRRPKSSDR